ncbi:MAG: pyrroline-5-carboxylate reductase [Caulobacteraceae bacterium]
MSSPITPLLIVGAGHMGGALIAGWLSSGTLAAADLILRDPAPGEVALAADADGALLNPESAAIGRARAVVLALKPQLWREAAGEITALLSPEALVISIMAGVRTADLEVAFAPRPVVRVMPNTAAAIGRGVAALYAPDSRLRGPMHALFEPIATVIDIDDEALMHAATAVGGSGPAYLYAYTEALAAAGGAAGLGAGAAARMARATVIGAAALMAGGEAPPSALRAQVTSRGGTTEAALSVLMGEGGLGPLLERAVRRAKERSEELGG